MKHEYKRNGPSRAYCQHPGCQAGVETGWFSELPDGLVEYLGEAECPHVYIPGRENPTREERIAYLVKYAKKEIKAWEKVIDFWVKHEKSLSSKQSCEKK